MWSSVSVKQPWKCHIMSSNIMCVLSIIIIITSYVQRLLTQTPNEHGILTVYVHSETVYHMNFFLTPFYLQSVFIHSANWCEDHMKWNTIQVPSKKIVLGTYKLYRPWNAIIFVLSAYYSWSRLLIIWIIS
jgi:hypothetical protein